MQCGEKNLNPIYSLGPNLQIIFCHNFSTNEMSFEWCQFLGENSPSIQTSKAILLKGLDP